MNIATSIYSESELLEHLFAATRKVSYEFSVADAAETTLGQIQVSDATVSFDSKNDIMRTFSGTVLKSDIMNLNCTDYRLTPWMCLEVGNDVIKWPLGKFIISASESYDAGIDTVQIAGYDLAKKISDDKFTTRYYAAAGTVYTSIVANILHDIYGNKTDVEQSPKTRGSDREWDMEETKLQIVNSMLSAVNYNPLHFNEYGLAVCSPHLDSEEMPIEIRYVSDKKSIIIDGLSMESNRFNVPNKFVRYTESPDEEYWVSIFENRDAESPYSIQNRHRTIVDTETVSDIYSQADLDAYTRREAARITQAAEVLSFSSLNMPGHGYRTCMFLSCDEYGIEGKFIETAWEMQLWPGGSMTHQCERAVTL